MIEKVFEKLKIVSSSIQKENDKFFPNGIELIYVKFGVPPVEFEIKVAGAAGVKGLLSDNQKLSWEQNTPG